MPGKTSWLRELGICSAPPPVPPEKSSMAPDSFHTREAKSSIAPDSFQMRTPESSTVPLSFHVRGPESSTVPFSFHRGRSRGAKSAPWRISRCPGKHHGFVNWEYARHHLPRHLKNPPWPPIRSTPGPKVERNRHRGGFGGAKSRSWRIPRTGDGAKSRPWRIRQRARGSRTTVTAEFWRHCRGTKTKSRRNSLCRRGGGNGPWRVGFVTAVRHRNVEASALRMRKEIGSTEDFGAAAWGITGMAEHRSSSANIPGAVLATFHARPRSAAPAKLHARAGVVRR